MLFWRNIIGDLIYDSKNPRDVRSNFLHLGGFLDPLNLFSGNRTKCVDTNLILPQKVATGTAYACLRPIEIPLSSANARSQEVLGLRMFPYAFLLWELKLYSYNSSFHSFTNLQI